MRRTISLNIALATVVQIFISGCDRNNDRQSIPIDRNATDFSLIDTSKVNPDIDSTSFIQFFNKFSQDTIYQIRHIAFPLRKIENDGDSSDTTYIREEEWSFVPFLELKKESGELQMSFGSSEARLVYSKVDTGIYVSHLFKKLNGEWWLVEVADESD